MDFQKKFQELSEQFLSAPVTIQVLIGVAALFVVYVFWKSVGKKPTGKHALTSANYLQVVRGLQKSNAQWPEIMRTLNPRNDRKLSQLLIELRGPHMFAPHVALNIIEAAVPSTLKAKPRASMRDILSESCSSMRKVTGFGESTRTR